MDYCGRRGTTNIPMIKIKDLFADYFDKKTFNNKKFIIDLIYDIQTLSVLKKYVKDRNNIIQSTPLLRFTSNQDDLSVSIEMFPDMDKSLIQNRIYYFLPSGFIEVQTNNPAFYDFSFKLHNELFILKRSEFSKKDIIIWLRLNEQSKDWKRWADKNIELFISKLDKKVTYIYDKKAEKFIFSK